MKIKKGEWRLRTKFTRPRKDQGKTHSEKDKKKKVRSQIGRT